MTTRNPDNQISLSHVEIVARFSRLLEAVKWTACLSDGEGIACIRDYLAGHEYSSEAVWHYGGSSAVIRDAASARVRAAVRENHARIQGVMRSLAEQERLRQHAVDEFRSGYRG